MSHREGLDMSIRRITHIYNQQSILYRYIRIFILLYMITYIEVSAYRSIASNSLIIGPNRQLERNLASRHLATPIRNDQERDILPKPTLEARNLESDTTSTEKSSELDDDDEEVLVHYKQTLAFLVRGFSVGLLTGIGVVIFKTSIGGVESVFYERLADILPKPAFYWPLALFPFLGSIMVACITAITGPKIRNGVDYIAQSIDSPDTAITLPASKYFYSDGNSTSLFKFRPLTSINNSYVLPRSSYLQNDSHPLSLSVQPMVETTKIERIVATIPSFDVKSQLLRLAAAVATLGSGCSLGPEGPAVEIGTSVSRIVASSGGALSPKEKHRLFLCGTAAAVAAGFNAPIAGIFFAIECGNRYLVRNTIKLDESAPEGPRADIAAIVIAASVAVLVSSLGLHESSALTIQGNNFALSSPIFELTAYAGLGLLSGLISVVFNKLRDFFTTLFSGDSWAKGYVQIPYPLRPIVGGLMCGLVAIFFPQTLFVGYTTLDQLLAGKIALQLPLVFQLLVLKIFLTSFSLGSGLIGGIFAPSLFMGASAGTLYHFLLNDGVTKLNDFFVACNFDADAMFTVSTFFTIANAPAYATVGAAATLGSLFRAPLTSSMLMFELTQNHDIVLPVLISTGLGGLFAELLSSPRRQW